MNSFKITFWQFRLLVEGREVKVGGGRQAKAYNGAGKVRESAR